MKIVLLYLSPNTTTKSAALALKANFQQAGHEVLLLNIGEKGNRRFENIDLGLFANTDAVGIGCPVYHLNLIEPMKDFLHVALPGIALRSPGIRAFTFFTYAGITTGKAFSNALKLLEQNQIGFAGGMKVKAPHFYDTGSFPDEAAKATVMDFCTRLMANAFAPMNPQKARAMFKKRKLIINIIYPFATVIGHLRRQPAVISPEKCTGCGKCAEQCPVDAIQIKNRLAYSDPKKCIYCYRCSMVCPKGAVSSKTEQIQKTVAMNKKIVGTETPANAVFI